MLVVVLILGVYFVILSIPFKYSTPACLLFQLRRVFSNCPKKTPGSTARCRRVIAILLEYAGVIGGTLAVILDGQNMIFRLLIFGVPILVSYILQIQSSDKKKKVASATHRLVTL